MCAPRSGCAAPEDGLCTHASRSMSPSSPSNSSNRGRHTSSASLCCTLVCVGTPSSGSPDQGAAIPRTRKFLGRLEEGTTFLWLWAQLLCGNHPLFMLSCKRHRSLLAARTRASMCVGVITIQISSAARVPPSPCSGPLTSDRRSRPTATRAGGDEPVRHAGEQPRYRASTSPPAIPPARAVPLGRGALERSLLWAHLVSGRARPSGAGAVTPKRGWGDFRIKVRSVGRVALAFSDKAPTRASAACRDPPPAAAHVLDKGPGVQLVSRGGPRGEGRVHVLRRLRLHPAHREARAGPNGAEKMCRS